MAKEDAKPDVVAFRPLRFLDRAIAQIDPERNRAQRHGIGLIGAGALGGRNQPFGKIQQFGLIEQRRHRGWQSVYGGSERKTRHCRARWGASERGG